MGYYISAYTKTICNNLVGLGSTSCTYNLGPMFHHALGEGGLYQLDGMKATEAIPIISEGICRMREDPEKYESMNPPNGWGKSEDAFEILTWLLERCEEYPSLEIGIS